MNLTPQQQKSQELMNALISRCWKDEAFKKQLIASPQETIEAFAGQPMNLPEGVQVRVNDQTDASVCNINIPLEPALDNLELTDEQLETISGGVLGVGEAIALVALGVTVFGGMYAAGKAATSGPETTVVYNECPPEN